MALTLTFCGVSTFFIFCYVYGEKMNEECCKIAQSIVVELLDRGCSVSTAESCTGGGIAASLTAVPGSSACVKGGVVAYAEEVKMSVLGVLDETLRTFGVVSQEVVVEMARGVMRLLGTDFAVATSGVAGPTGGTEAVPVGTIWIAVVSHNEESTYCIRSYDEGRKKNTQHAVLEALGQLQKMIENEENQGEGQIND